MSQEINQPIGPQEGSSPISFEKLLETHDAEVDKEYADALVRSTEQDAIKFGLEDIPEDVKPKKTLQLQEKLKEYTLRIKEDSGKYPFLAVADLAVSPRYKRDVLRLVLKHGFINTWALGRAYGKLDGYLEGRRFNHACGVVERYIKTGGSGVAGGTGLPDVASN